MVHLHVHVQPNESAVWCNMVWTHCQRRLAHIMNSYGEIVEINMVARSKVIVKHSDLDRRMEAYIYDV